MAALRLLAEKLFDIMEAVDIDVRRLLGEAWQLSGQGSSTQGGLGAGDSELLLLRVYCCTPPTPLLLVPRLCLYAQLTTEKMLRQKTGEALGVDLSHRKAEIRALVGAAP